MKADFMAVFLHFVKVIAGILFIEEHPVNYGKTIA